MSTHRASLRRPHLPKLALLIAALIFVALVLWYTAAAADAPSSKQRSCAPAACFGSLHMPAEAPAKPADAQRS